MNINLYIQSNFHKSSNICIRKNQELKIFEHRLMELFLSNHIHTKYPLKRKYFEKRQQKMMTRNYTPWKWEHINLTRKVPFN